VRVTPWHRCNYFPRFLEQFLLRAQRTRSTLGGTQCPHGRPAVAGGCKFQRRDGARAHKGAVVIGLLAFMMVGQLKDRIRGTTVILEVGLDDADDVEGLFHVPIAQACLCFRLNASQKPAE
jgi:hypothetical protein